MTRQHQEEEEEDEDCNSGWLVGVPTGAFCLLLRRLMMSCFVCRCLMFRGREKQHHQNIHHQSSISGSALSRRGDKEGECVSSSPLVQGYFFPIQTGMMCAPTPRPRTPHHHPWKQRNAGNSPDPICLSNINLLTTVSVIWCPFGGVVETCERELEKLWSFGLSLLQ